MSDLVERLRDLWSTPNTTMIIARDLHLEAADRIEALELQCEAYADIADRALMTKMKGYRDRIETLEAALRLLIDRDVITNSPSLGAIVTGYDPPLALDDIQMARRALGAKT